jgi:hypothetical protein
MMAKIGPSRIRQGFRGGDRVFGRIKAAREDLHLPRGYFRANGWLVGACRSETRLAEQAAVNLAHAVFEVDAVVGFVQISNFAVLGGGDAESAGELAYRVKHDCLPYLHIALQQYRMGFSPLPTPQPMVSPAWEAWRVNRMRRKWAGEMKPQA